MSHSRKPYLKVAKGEYFIVFNNPHNIFIDSVYDYCKKNKIPYAIRPISSGRLHIRIESLSLATIKKLMFFIKNEYEEFHSYNREVHRLIKHKML